MTSPRGPHVLIIGGFLTEALMYRPMRRRLLEQGAERVTIAPIHLPDWAVMGLAGMGPLLLRGARAIREARRASSRPIIVVGHSMGGVIARLAMASEPLDGRAAGVAADVGCLVTLGSPHRFDPRLRWRHPGVRATEHLERVSPGAWFAPSTGYVSVGSTMVPPARRAPLRSPAQWLNRVLVTFVGTTNGARGDGLIDAPRSRLDGAHHVEFDDVVHGITFGPWYGDSEVIERWWPAALEAWQAALAARGRTGEGAAGASRAA